MKAECSLCATGRNLPAGNGAGEARVPQRGKRSAKESDSDNAEADGIFLRFHHSWYVFGPSL